MFLKPADFDPGKSYPVVMDIHGGPQGAHLASVNQIATAYASAGFVVLLIAGAFALDLWSDGLTRLAFVPTAQFRPQAPLGAKVYDDPGMWIARGAPDGSQVSHWLPPGVEPAAEKLGVAVFFVHPTSYLEKAQWNAPLDDVPSRQLAETFVQGMASPFNAATR